MLEFISILALIFLSLFGYSAGVISVSQKRVGIEPGIVDLILIVIILAVAFVLGSLFDINRWFWVLITALASGFIGFLRSTLWHPIQTQKAYNQSESQPTKRNLWTRWINFSTRVGGFQTRIILSIVYLIVISIVALPMRLFSDPLQIKIQTKTSYWLKRTEREVLTEALKQY
jgi:hypothetical protein